MDGRVRVTVAHIWSTEEPWRALGQALCFSYVILLNPHSNPVSRGCEDPHFADEETEAQLK